MSGDKAQQTDVKLDINISHNNDVEVCIKPQDDIKRIYKHNFAGEAIAIAIELNFNDLDKYKNIAFVDHDDTIFCLSPLCGGRDTNDIENYGLYHGQWKEALSQLKDTMLICWSRNSYLKLFLGDYCKVFHGFLYGRKFSKTKMMSVALEEFEKLGKTFENIYIFDDHYKYNIADNMKQKFLANLNVKFIHVNNRSGLTINNIKDLNTCDYKRVVFTYTTEDKKISLLKEKAEQNDFVLIQNGVVLKE